MKSLVYRLILVALFPLLWLVALVFALIEGATFWTWWYDTLDCYRNWPGAMRDGWPK